MDLGAFSVSLAITDLEARRSSLETRLRQSEDLTLPPCQGPE